MNKGIIVVSVVLAMFISGCSNGAESKSFTEVDDSELGSLAQSIREQVGEENSGEETAIFDPSNPALDPSTFTIENVQELQTLSENILMLNQEAKNLDQYSNQWLCVTDVVVTGYYDKECYIISYGDKIYTFRDDDNYWKAMDAAEACYMINVIGYMTVMDGEFELTGCIFAGNGSHIDDPSFYSGQIYGKMRGETSDPPTDPTGPDGTIEDYIQSQNDPNAPIDQQIIDGIGDAFDYAAQDPNQSQEDQDFAQAFGDAWDFATALKRAGY